ncbi:hypothetical protein GUJ93_ZPchr0005g14927 [Zizania palustris]|uniref:Uncharacterized protein n=1 Tax=Zizania palustris TaxID=103762 RepID=A0A8J5VHF6_ZIZPA|nr:hypothetical protein GUJ93_ZPchr0005g14927 [Zizania palustris]
MHAYVEPDLVFFHRFYKKAIDFPFLSQVFIESCDLNKDEAEILKPSSSSSSSPSPTTTSPSPPTAQMPEPPPPQSTPLAAAAAAAAAQLLPKTCEGILIEASKRRKLAEATTDAHAVAAMAAEPLSPVLFVNRCNVCCKRVGLTGLPRSLRSEAL